MRKPGSHGDHGALVNNPSWDPRQQLVSIAGHLTEMCPEDFSYWPASNHYKDFPTKVPGMVKQR